MVRGGGRVISIVACRAGRLHGDKDRLGACMGRTSEGRSREGNENSIWARAWERLVFVGALLEKNERANHRR